MRASSRRFIIPVVLAGACGGPAGQGGSPAPAGSGPQGQLEPRTEAVLAGPLCQSDSCRCREGDADAGSPAAGLKRFEVRLGPSDDPLWTVVDGMVMFKSDQRQEACFYVDLKPGTHEVRFRDRGKQGLNAAVAIAEQGGAEDATWWYHTFDFQCGAGQPGACDVESIERWKQQVTALRGKHDPCGSTKVQTIRWETGRMPDRTRPDEIDLHLTLNLYKFTPENPPGSDECDKRPASGQESGAAE